MTVTALLQQAFDKAADLPEDRQDDFARFLLAELGAERRWDELFSRPESDELLEELTAKALEAHRASLTKPLKSKDL